MFISHSSCFKIEMVVERQRDDTLSLALHNYFENEMVMEMQRVRRVSFPLHYYFDFEIVMERKRNDTMPYLFISI